MTLMRSNKRYNWAAGLFLALWLMPVAAGQTRLHAQLTPCHVSNVGEEVLCGKLPVYENRVRRSGRKIQLNVVVLPALEEGQNEAPLFDLQGGPGLAATEQARWYVGELKEYRRHRDVVLVDQRGTGDSNPLHCEEPANEYLNEMYSRQYVKKCLGKLREIADLTQYTTPIAMDDLDDVRAWLGYDKINLIGLSYGTRAALVYMRQHPKHVRSVVLMGVTPTNAKLPLYHAQTADRALKMVFNDCSLDSACAAAFPNLRRDLDSVLAALAAKKAKQTYVLPKSGKNIEVEFGRDVFTEVLRRQLYTPAGGRLLPFIIHASAHGNFLPFLKLAIDEPAPNGAGSIEDGMYLSITCTEDVPFIASREAEALTSNTVFGSYRIVRQQSACRVWPRAKLPPGYRRPVKSQAPVLIISGREDPVTPVEWASEAAQYLTNSVHVIVPHHAHVFDGLTNINCLDRVTLEFLAQANARGLDLRCFNQMMPPPFKLK